MNYVVTLIRETESQRFFTRIHNVEDIMSHFLVLVLVSRLLLFYYSLYCCMKSINALL